MESQKGKFGKYHVKDNKNLFFYPQEVKKILSDMKQNIEIPFTILINTGARYNEAKHIKVEDIDFERKSLILKVTKVRHRLGEARPTPRIIPISSQFAKKLDKWRRDLKLSPDSTFPFIEPAWFNTKIKMLAKDIGRNDWQDFSVHNLRKTFETWLIAMGVDTIKVVKHLGHSMDVATKHYISADIFTPQDKKMMRELLGDLYEYRGERY